MQDEGGAAILAELKLQVEGVDSRGIQMAPGHLLGSRRHIANRLVYAFKVNNLTTNELSRSPNIELGERCDQGQIPDQ